jgi:hypothetical protein
MLTINLPERAYCADVVSIVEGKSGPLVLKDMLILFEGLGICLVDIKQQAFQCNIHEVPLQETTHSLKNLFIKQKIYRCA